MYLIQTTLVKKIITRWILLKNTEKMETTKGRIKIDYKK